jgi:hypothetical protein
MATCKNQLGDYKLDAKEVLFIQAMSLIAHRFGCTITHIDYAKKEIHMDGPEDAQYDAAIAMTDYQDMIEC